MFIKSNYHIQIIQGRIFLTLEYLSAHISNAYKYFQFYVQMDWNMQCTQWYRILCTYFLWVFKSTKKICETIMLIYALIYLE